MSDDREFSKTYWQRQRELVRNIAMPEMSEDKRYWCEHIIPAEKSEWDYVKHASVVTTNWKRCPECGAERPPENKTVRMAPVLYSLGGKWFCSEEFFESLESAKKAFGSSRIIWPAKPDADGYYTVELDG